MKLFSACYTCLYFKEITSVAYISVHTSNVFSCLDATYVQLVRKTKPGVIIRSRNFKFTGRNVKNGGRFPYWSREM
jgi:hypothetical protein